MKLPFSYKENSENIISCANKDGQEGRPLGLVQSFLFTCITLLKGKNPRNSAPMAGYLCDFQ